MFLIFNEIIVPLFQWFSFLRMVLRAVVMDVRRSCTSPGTVGFPELWNTEVYVE
jgi:hypothetical protein